MIPQHDIFWTQEARVCLDQRKHMVIVIEELIRLKEYSDRAFYTACNIADLYILSLSRLNH